MKKAKMPSLKKVIALAKITEVLDDTRNLTHLTQ